MTIVFQVLAVVAIATAAMMVIRGNGARHQAIRRVLMLVFVGAAASSVFLPSLWTAAAHLLGIGRGTDLLLYLLVLSFFAYVATTHRRFRHVENQITDLARELALANAVEPKSAPRTKSKRTPPA